MKKNKKNKEITYFENTEFFKKWDIDPIDNLTSKKGNYTFLHSFINLKKTRVGEKEGVTFGIDLFLFLEKLDLTPNVEYNILKPSKPKTIELILYKDLPEYTISLENNKVNVIKNKITLHIKLIRRDMFDEKAIQPNTEMIYWSDYHKYLVLPEKTKIVFEKELVEGVEEYKQYYEDFILNLHMYPQFMLGKFEEDEKPSEELSDKFMSVSFPNFKTIITWV